MGTVLHLPQKSKQRNHSPKTEKKDLMVMKAEYLKDFQIRLFFSNGESKVIDFLPLFSVYVKGEFTKYFSPERFRKFIVKNGNIYWGRNEDVIFPVNLLLKSRLNNSNEKEEVIFVI